MDSSLKKLKECAEAIQNKNSEAAEALMGEICGLAERETDTARRKVLKYFAEALVRRAYGLNPTNSEFTFLKTPLSWYTISDARSLVKDAIATRVTGKNRVHIVDFCFEYLIDWQRLLEKLGKGSGNPTSVRISVIVPPLLENSADVQKAYRPLRTRAESSKVTLEKLQVVKANNLGEVDASMLDFRRTEEEAVVVNYMCNFHLLLAESGAMEKEWSKLKEINPEILIILEHDVNLNEFNFVKRLEDCFQYYCSIFSSINNYGYRLEKYYRREISNVLGCEGRNRIVRRDTWTRWKSRLETAGFLSVPIRRPPRKFRSGYHMEEKEGCLLFSSIPNNCPPIFLSAWKLSDSVDHFNPISSNSDPASDPIIPLQVFHESFSLNRMAARAEIYDLSEDVCYKYGLPLALTWVNWGHVALSIESSCCYVQTWNGSSFMENCAKHKLVEGQAIAGEALQSNELFHFVPDITYLPEYDYPLANSAKNFRSRAAVAVCLRSHYATDDVYVVEFYFPDNNDNFKEPKFLELGIFNDLKNLKKHFVTIRVPGNEICSNKDVISNILQAPMPMQDSTPASPTANFFTSLNVASPPDAVEPRYDLVLEIQELNEQGEGIPNFHPAVPSSPAAIGPINELSPKSSSNGVLETQGPDHEEGNGKQTSSQSIVNDENEIVKVDVNNLPIRRTKRRKLTSDVWEEFAKKEDEDGKKCAICVHCERKFDGSSKKGTTHLRNHLKRCKGKTIKVRDQQLIFSPGRGDSKNESVSDEGNSSFDQDKSSMDVARMIIKHQCPLNMVEDEFFKALLKNLQPLFKLQAKEALSFDIFCVYNEEKGRLLKYFDKLSCRFNLIVNLWADDLEEKFTYCCYSVQFTDENWKLRENILAIKSFKHECDTGIFYENFKSLLMDWNFHKKVCSLTIQNSSAGFKITEELRKSWLSFEALHPLRTFYISCHDCIHGLLGKEISGENIGKPIDGASKTSSACFMDIHDIYYKKLSQQEKGYSLMNVISDDNNWRTCSLVLAIATVLDPRFKFHLVEFSYSQIYDYGSAKIHLTIIHSVFMDIFNEYASHMYNGTSLFDDTNSFALSNVEENILESFHRWYNSKSNVRTEASWKSELDKYLGESIISSKMELDVLGWWSEHATSFPILAKMACDILAIPMSSIIWGSSFSAKVMMNNSTFSGLDPQTIEAMICSKDWLESPKESCNIVRLKDSPSLAHHLEFKCFFSESDNEASRHGDLEREAIGRETGPWSEKDVRAYLASPFTDEDIEHFRTWKGHAKSKELIGQDEIPAKALIPLLMIPSRDIDLEDARKYYIEDTVVNQFFILLERRHERFPHKYIKHYSFNSFTATFLITKSKTEAEVLSWVKQKDLKGVRKLFLPMCLHEHWLLFVADIDAKKLLWLDSMENSKMSNDSEKQVIQRWFLDFLLPKMGHNHRKDWLFDVPNDIPLQKNSVDCAVFLMKYADCLTHGNSFPFTQYDMPSFRYRTFLDLCRGSLRS